MKLLKNALSFVVITSLLVAAINSACKEKQAEANIIYKIPDPLRKGVKKNNITSARVDLYKLVNNQLKNNRDTFYLIEYDTNGNVIREGKNRYSYDKYGFKNIEFHDGEDYSYKHFIAYKQISPLQLNSCIYDLINQEWDSEIDTNKAHRVLEGPNYEFNASGNLAKVKFDISSNQTYLYNAKQQLVRIVDSFKTNSDLKFHTRITEFNYNKETLAEINIYEDSNLFSKSLISKEGLIDTTKFYHERELWFIKVYQYK